MGEIWGVPRTEWRSGISTQLPALEARLRVLARRGDANAASSLAYLAKARRGGSTSTEYHRLIRTAARLGEPSAQLELAFASPRRARTLSRASNAGS